MTLMIKTIYFFFIYHFTKSLLRLLVKLKGKDYVSNYLKQKHKQELKQIQKDKLRFLETFK